MYKNLLIDYYNLERNMLHNLNEYEWHTQHTYYNVNKKNTKATTKGYIQCYVNKDVQNIQ